MKDKCELTKSKQKNCWQKQIGLKFENKKLTSDGSAAVRNKLGFPGWRRERDSASILSLFSKTLLASWDAERLEHGWNVCNSFQWTTLGLRFLVCSRRLLIPRRSTTLAFHHGHRPRSHPGGLSSELTPLGVAFCPFKVMFPGFPLWRLRNYWDTRYLSSQRRLRPQNVLFFLFVDVDNCCETLKIARFDKDNKHCFSLFWQKNESGKKLAPTLILLITFHDFTKVVITKEILVLKSRICEKQFSSNCFVFVFYFASVGNKQI